MEVTSKAGREPRVVSVSQWENTNRMNFVGICEKHISLACIHCNQVQQLASEPWRCWKGLRSFHIFFFLSQSKVRSFELDFI